MTRDEMDAAIRLGFGFPTAVPVDDYDRIVFLAGMRAAADIANLSGTDPAFAIRAAADELELSK